MNDYYSDSDSESDNDPEMPLDVKETLIRHVNSKDVSKFNKCLEDFLSTFEKCFSDTGLEEIMCLIDDLDFLREVQVVISRHLARPERHPWILRIWDKYITSEHIKKSLRHEIIKSMTDHQICSSFLQLECYRKVKYDSINIKERLNDPLAFTSGIYEYTIAYDYQFECLFDHIKMCIHEIRTLLDWTGRDGAIKELMNEIVRRCINPDHPQFTINCLNEIGKYYDLSNIVSPMNVAFWRFCPETSRHFEGSLC